MEWARDLHRDLGHRQPVRSWAGVLGTLNRAHVHVDVGYTFRVCEAHDFEAEQRDGKTQFFDRESILLNLHYACIWAALLLMVEVAMRMSRTMRLQPMPDSHVSTGGPAHQLAPVLYNTRCIHGGCGASVVSGPTRV